MWGSNVMSRRPTSLSLARVLLVVLSSVPALHSRPTWGSSPIEARKHLAEEPGSPAFWWKLGVSVILVLLGGVFSGASLLRKY